MTDPIIPSVTSFDPGDRVAGATLDTIITGDSRDVLATLPDNSVNCCVTSPPYFGLRDYGVDGQIGLEPTPDAYVDALVGVFREVRRVLRDDGTCWLNLGDTYSNAGKWGGSKGYDTKQASNVGSIRRTVRNARDIGAKPKDLLLIPSRVAIALQDDGWYVRAEIIWAKPNAMPESVQDRPTKSHEQVYLLTKSERYYYDAEAIRDESAPSSQARARYNGKQTAQPKATQGVVDGVYCGVPSMAKAYGQGRNKRSVWTIPTQPYSGAHFAVMPEALVEPCILAGCPEGGVVLDPFGGAATVGVVAKRLNRRFILIELNPDYAELGRDRLNGVTPMFPGFAQLTGTEGGA